MLKNIKNIFKKKRMKLRLLCFDLDNTLYNYGIAEAETEAHVAELICSKDKKSNPANILRKFNEIKKHHMHHDVDPKMFSRKLWFRELLSSIKFKDDTEAFSKYLEDEYWSYLMPRTQMFPNTTKVLASLKKKYKLACISDSDGDRAIKMKRIHALDLEKYFDYIITTDDTGKNKPSIENWEYLLKLSGLKAAECMMIGDHPDVDLLNAKKLGFKTVWSKQHLYTDMHFRYVDHEIKDIIELLDIVKKY